MCIGTCKAQTFNFGCEPSFEGTITVTGSPFIFQAYDPNNTALPSGGNGNNFELTIPGIYTLIMYIPTPPHITKTITITTSGNQTLLWSEI